VRRKHKPVVDPKIAKRVGKVQTEQLLTWLDTTIIGLGISVDNWRYHNAAPGDVELSIEAIYAIWQELRSRGLTDR
jgi:hypothetical protein